MLRADTANRSVAGVRASTSPYERSAGCGRPRSSTVAIRMASRARVARPSPDSRRKRPSSSRSPAGLDTGADRIAGGTQAAPARTISLAAAVRRRQEAEGWAGGAGTVVLGAGLAGLMCAVAAGAQEPSTPPPPPGAEATAARAITSCCRTSDASGPRWAPPSDRPGIPITWAGAGRSPPSSTCPSRVIAPAASPTRSFSGSAAERSETFTVTDTLAYVANLARGASPEDALAGPPRGALSRAAPGAHPPAPARRLALRPQVHADRPRSRAASPLCHRRAGRLARHDPAGVPGRDAGSRPRGCGPLHGRPSAGAGRARHSRRARAASPSAVHAGAGLEIRVSRGLSLNLDYRLTRVDRDHSLHAASAVVGMHW